MVFELGRVPQWGFGYVFDGFGEAYARNNSNLWAVPTVLSIPFKWSWELSPRFQVMLAKRIRFWKKELAGRWRGRGRENSSWCCIVAMHAVAR